MCNKDIRAAISGAGLKYWEVAKLFGCTDGSFSRKLRHELPEKDKQKIFAIIDELSKGEPQK